MGLTKTLLDDSQTWEDLDRAMELYFLEQEQMYNEQKQQDDESN